MMTATVIIAYYAYVTIKEGRKTRRKDTVEKMLEGIISPLCEILRKAWSEEWVVTESDFQRMNSIVEKYGHYLGETNLPEFLRSLENMEHAKAGGRVGWRFTAPELMDRQLHTIESRRDMLVKVLREDIRV